MKRAIALLALLVANAQAAEPGPRDFAWQGTLELPAASALVRVPVPAEALMRLQSPAANDLRVFDGASQPVPFALAVPPRSAELPRERTDGWRALPLHTGKPGARAPKGTVQVRVDGGGASSVWVQLSPGATDAQTDSPRLPSALFDTRKQKEPLAALVVRARLPANAPVRITAATSTDLASWEPVALRGRLYRFEGEGAPVNDTLELAQPLQLEGRFLRLEWSGQDGVTVDSVIGVLPAKTPKTVPPSAALPAGRADGANALEWQLPFATPIARLELAAAQPNTLLPVRILSRNNASEPWRLLGASVVYRLGAAGDESQNPPVVLQRASGRWLRVEATHGMRLQGAQLAVRAVFDPLELIVVAGRATPYTLAAGRAQAEAVALPVSMLAAASTARLDTLPAARVAAMRSTPETPQPAWMRWLPAGIDGKTAGLWLVLVLGVLMLGGVAWSLLRQVNRAAPPPS